ncbi:putative Mg2+ transporter-C (MgtC) family protein [Mucilaginibacter yixingensis]|uniref:Putative Mg2+ transporter-C (MgtC) family protein n=1 Tax=Mucilaginibacter yixingensis TaxID=1295612 RepID=A0A2T5JB06_9SPHI|nr:MgtC/SapB family protein [Mucilaginibacter yixingensis]PTQ98050.1 putative Mg2+ transporter-C (MgtC) family protein [Mucilaginibacter yixingensis]
MILPTTELLIRLSAAILLGAIVGFERQKHEWAAGLRTHMLVCLGAALIMIVSAYGFAGVVGKPGYNLDPSRVAAQVVSGIGFLGAGTILFLRQEVVRGLTTAAGLWTVAAIGLACGGGLYLAAGFTTIAVWIILALIKPLETRFINKEKFKGFTIRLERKEVSLQHIEDALRENHVKYRQISVTPAFEEDLDEMRISLEKNAFSNVDPMAMIETLRKLKGVREVTLLMM